MFYICSRRAGHTSEEIEELVTGSTGYPSLTLLRLSQFIRLSTLFPLSSFLIMRQFLILETPDVEAKRGHRLTSCSPDGK